MGSFYVSFVVRDGEQAAVAAALKALGRTALVSPARDGYVYFYDAKADEQDEAEIDTLGEAISQQLDTVVLAVLNHDDDVLIYWLFERGAEIDRYNSFPGYFGSEEDEDDGILPQGGDAAKLVRSLGASTSAKKVHEVLRADNEREEYVFALDRHATLAQLLGLAPELCCLGYQDCREDGSEIPDRAAFVDVG